jgi:TfoX/Sxy family transcriptional regulator of competence genes
MAYDEELANRIRSAVDDEADVTERPMFGGLAFLVAGHMAVAVSRAGGLLVRVDPTRADALLRGAGVSPMEMGGRQMRGWLRVDADHVRTTRQLTRWVGLGVSFVRTLPPKR